MSFLALIAQATLVEVLDAQLAAPQLKGAIVAALVVDRTGAALYSRNADLRMTPASNQKLLTLTYALARLGPDSTFAIRFWKQPGGWYVDAPGHPTATWGELTTARESLGIRPADKVAIRVGYRPLMPPSWEWDDLPNKYAAKPASLTVDRGSFELWATGGRATLLPMNYGVKVRLMGGSVRRVDFKPTGGTVGLYGPVPSERTRLDTLALPDPQVAAQQVLGGHAVASSQPPPSRPADYTITSRPMREIAAECLQKSDNNIAENLLLLAAASEGPLGDDPYDVATKRLKAFLVKDVGCDEADLRPTDGSGLSRHNLVTARALAKVLAFSRDRWGDAWLSMLATSGRGTLEKRLTGSSFRGKTGSLDSVSALSGYLTDISKNPLVLVLVFNQTIAPASEIRAIQDSIVAKIESHSGGTDLDAHDHSEGRYTNPLDRAVYRHRDYRPRVDRSVARQWNDRRAESADAGLHRAR